MLLLDTNVVSELRKTRSGRANAAVVGWARGVLSASLHLSVVSVMEIELGIRLKERRDARQAQVLEAWLTTLLDRFGDRLLPVDTRVARRCAALHVPDPRPERDAFIAATADVHGLTLVTRNVSDFRGTGVALVNPWEWRGND